MCTLALFLNVIDEYPLLVAANRDEHYDRPAAPPALIAGEPKILAGKDLRAGGTWLGVNEHGLLVGILNRRANGPRATMSAVRSRGWLCMDLLSCKSALEAGEYLRRHEAIYNPFTLVYADPANGGVAFNNEGKIILCSLDSGLHVFSSSAAVDTQSGKADRAHGHFMLWARERPFANSTEDWLARLRALLGDHILLCGDDPRDAICVHGTESGTVSSSIIRYSTFQRRFESYYCAGAPCKNVFAAPLALDIL